MHINAAASVVAEITASAATRDVKPEDWAPLIAEVPLFSGLSSRHVRKIAAIARIRRVPRLTDIVREGSVGTAFFVLLDGQAEVVRKDRPVLLGPGSFFGELALLDDGPRTATVRALDESLLLEIPRSKFSGILKDEPTVARTLLRELARRLRGDD